MPTATNLNFLLRKRVEPNPIIVDVFINVYFILKWRETSFIMEFSPFAISDYYLADNSIKDLLFTSFRLAIESRIQLAEFFQGFQIQMKTGRTANFAFQNIALAFNRFKSSKAFR